MTTDAAAGIEDAERWEIAYQWRRLWRSLKWIAGGAIAFFALLAVGQIYLFQQIFSSVHPALGGAFIALITGFFIWFIGAPLVRFLRAPSIAEPPNVDLHADRVDAAALRKRVDFDDAYLKNIASNPALAAHHEDAQKALADLRTLGAENPDGGAAKLAQFERERIAALLVDLDKRVDNYIHQEALAVGTATAVSMNGSIDAFIVLWRNINMISRISRLYYGRPSMRLTLVVLRDVMVAVLLSRSLDDLTDTAGDALGRVVSRLGAAVVGPLMDGSINALMTLKLGYLAKRRCRSFDVWSKASAMRAVSDVFKRVRKESTGLTGELVKLSGGVVSAAGKASGLVAGLATDAAGNIAAAPKSAWALVQNSLVRKPPPEEGA